MTPLISIIIPVYNSENTIKETLKSIQEQSFTDFEVIIVNDGSTDNTINIVYKFCQLDNRFKLINQKNFGVSVARNIGLDNVNGKWVCFIDSDDLISREYLSDFVENINNSTCLIQISRVVIFGGDEKEIIINKPNIDDLLNYTLENQNMVYVWGKLYNYDVIKNNRIRFNSDLIIGEDFFFNLNFILKIDKNTLSFCRGNGGYIYHEHNSSLSRKFNSELLKERNKTAQEISNLLEHRVERSYLNRIYTEFGLIGNVRYILRNKKFLSVYLLLKYIDESKSSYQSILKCKSSIILKLIACNLLFVKKWMFK